MYTIKSSMWRIYKRRRRKRASSITKHYVSHKENTRTLVLSRLEHFNQHYNLQWNRVAIRNQRRCWGSCTSLKNLNFNYKLFFLPEHLMDYIVVHELCHLVELNHGKNFWSLVEQTIPDYRDRIKELKEIEKRGMSYQFLETLKDNSLSSVVTSNNV